MRWLALSAIMLTAAGCQQDRGRGRTDSASHWMTSCLASDECGALSCLCNVCTAPCDAAVCGELGGECSVAPLYGGEALKSCFMLARTGDARAAASDAASLKTTLLR